MKRRDFAKLGLAAGAMIPLQSILARKAFGKTPQGAPLPGSAIPQFVDELPALQLVDGTNGPIALSMEEFQSMVMPTGFVPAAGTYTGTHVWGYRDAASGTKPYIGPVILAKRGVPTQVTYVNNLGTGAGSQLYWEDWTDQTLHWALHTHSMNHYTGTVPAVPHLHGGEVPPELDGGPDAWFTADGSAQGHAYYTKALTGAGGKSCTYRYPNTQEAANIWFHDHALGITRLNVYAGMAGAYLLRDDALALPPGLTPYGLGSELIVPLVIQDRMFDVDGQLYFPNLGINPEHPYWIPEFVGDTIVVNGKVWPTFGTAAVPKPAKRYRFLFLNGSNARVYEFFFVNPVNKAMGPPLWVIGTDGGYLDTPVKLDPALGQKLVVMPGERYDVIVDFSAYAGQQLILRNTGNTPYPKGAPPQGSTLGQAMKFFIGAPEADSGYDPASGTPLRPPMVRLVNPAVGTAAVATQKRRQLTLNEVMGPGGPLEVLVNNTKWGGHSVATDVFPGGIRPDFTVGPDGMTYYSELPKEGETELWEIINLTADAHPIHLHLVQFQLMNRQNFNVNRYAKAYDASFPGSTAIDPMTGAAFPAGVFIGAYGPPLDYNTGNPVALGGNPDVTPYLQGPAKPPAAHEAGWKDTVMMLPGQVTRIVVRWTPTDVPATTAPNTAAAAFPFSPDGGHGYVWHCHIIDHEDNEMMRPDLVVPNPAKAARDYVKGVDY